MGFAATTDKVSSEIVPYVRSIARGEKGDVDDKAFWDPYRFHTRRMEVLVARDEADAAYDSVPLMRECNAYLETLQTLADVSIDKRSFNESELNRLADSLLTQRQLILRLMAKEMRLLASTEFVRIAHALEPKIVRDQAEKDRPQWWQYIIQNKDDPGAPWTVRVLVRLLRRLLKLDIG